MKLCSFVVLTERVTIRVESTGFSLDAKISNYLLHAIVYYKKEGIQTGIEKLNWEDMHIVVYFNEVDSIHSLLKSFLELVTNY